MSLPGIQEEGEILQMDINSLHNALQLSIISGIINEHTYEDEIHHIKNGFKIKIPIEYITQEWYVNIPEIRKTRIKSYGLFSITQFIEEITQRKMEIMRILIEHFDDSPTKRRN